jgi:hypothetical protein
MSSIQQRCHYQILSAGDVLFKEESFSPWNRARVLTEHGEIGKQSLFEINTPVHMHVKIIT